MVGMKLGALIGGALDASDGGDDSIIDGTLKGAAIGGLINVVLPVVITYATGWLVLRGLAALKDQALGNDNEPRKAH